MSLQSFRAQIRQARNLSRVMSRGNAVRLAFANRPGAEMSIYLRCIGLPVHLRPGTADRTVLEKVFLQQEYAVPFPITPRRIVDAGAHIGLASLYFSSRYLDSEIVAVEPEASNFALLAKNCSRRGQIRLMQGALWSRTARLIGASSPASNDGFAVREAGTGTGNIRGLTLDEILAETGWDSIDLLKLDIEGSELELFKGVQADWLGRVRIIAIELHDRFRSGCSRAFYEKVTPRLIAQEISGENVFVLLSP